MYRSQVDKTCGACGKEFSVPRCRTELARFCSVKCHAAIRGHRPIEERFWEKVQKTDSCWLWTGATTSAGYGRIDSFYAHRFALGLIYEPLEEGVEGCHKCDNPPCVRVHPDHVFLGTHSINMEDAKSKGRMRRGSSNPRAKLTEEIVKNVFQLQKDGLTGRAIARLIGVSHNTIARVLRGDSWTHVDKGHIRPPD